MSSATVMNGQQTPRTALHSRYLRVSVLLIVLHAFFMLCRYGQLPIAPAVPDEIIINDASISLARGNGYLATSFADSKYGLDHMFAHFPPVYPYVEALAFRLFGVSIYSLRLTTTLMSILSAIVLSLLLYRLCRKGLLSWDAALILNALYCTNASVIALERMARMESMISLLSLLSLGAIFYVCTQTPDQKTWPGLIAAGLWGALSIAVHPEAVTALVLLGLLMVVVVPGRLSVKLASVGLFVLIPFFVGLVIYGSQLVSALHQFMAIARDSNLANPTSSEWLLGALHNSDLSAVNRNLFLVLIMLLLALAPVIYFSVARKLPHDSLRYRLSATVSVASVIDIALMVFLFRMSDRRCQFLFAPMLICNVLCFWGTSKLRAWQRRLGWSIVVLQCAVGVFYLSARHDRVADMDPDRYLTLIDQLPHGASVASTPGLWLDFQEVDRPFTLILYGLDGELKWGRKGSNPFDRFDVIILEEYYAVGRPWWAEDAKQGRLKRTYRVGGSVVDVYTRETSKSATGD